MGRWLQLIIGVLAAGATQFGVMIAASAAAAQIDPAVHINWIVIVASVLGTMGTTAAGLLKQLPQKEWTPEERAAKLGELK